MNLIRPGWRLRHGTLVVASLTVVLVALVLSACGGTTTTATQATTTQTTATAETTATTGTAESTATTGTGQTGPVTIGLLAPLTGASPLAGQMAQRGVDLYLEEVGGQVAGRQLQLIVEDTGADPALGLSKAKKLVENDKVDVVIGPLFDHVKGSVLPYVGQQGVPIITYSGHSPETLAAGKGVAWMPGGDQVATTAPGGAYAYDVLGYRTITVLHNDYSSGEQYTQGFIDAFEAKGGKMIQRQKVPLGTMDFAPYISSMQEADAVVFWLVPDEGPRFLSQYHEYGMDMPLFLTATLSGPEPALQDVGDFIVGMYAAGLESAALDTPANKAFVELYKSKFDNATPGIHEIYQGYIAVQLYCEALKSTGGDASPDAINAALAKLKVETPAGSLSFTEDGVGVGPVYMMQMAKEGDRFFWKVIDTIPDVVRDSTAQ